MVLLDVLLNSMVKWIWLIKVKLLNIKYLKTMKKLIGNEFELREDAMKMLEMVESEFGGIGQCERGSDEIWAVTGCNGFETVSLSYDEQREIYVLNVTNCFWSRGEEILNFIVGNKHYVL